MNNEIIGVMAALSSAASWALAAILFKMLGSQLPPVAMTLAKSIVGSILLGVVLLEVGFEAVDSDSLNLLIASGVLGIALADTFFFAALRNLSAYVIVVFFMLGHVLTVFLAILILGESVEQFSGIGILLTIGGISIVLLSQSWGEDSGSSNAIGLFYGTLSMLCMSGSTLIAKQALIATPTLQATLIRMLSGLAGIYIYSLFTRQPKGFFKPFFNLKFSALFLLSVSIVTFGGFWLSLVGVKYLDVAIANTLNSTEPLFALPLAVIFLKERVTFPVVLGSLIAICGMIVLTEGWLPKELIEEWFPKEQIKEVIEKWHPIEQIKQWLPTDLFS